MEPSEEKKFIKKSTFTEQEINNHTTENISA
jgi:hypothetical protein